MIDKSYGIDDIQIELLDLIKHFDKICSENGISYSLYGGSCLGAVRDGGFIPWDDDLDICVTRQMLDKLMNCILCSETFTTHKELWIQRIQKRDAVAIRGYVPTLDIFVVDRAPDNELLFKAKILLLKVLQGMLKGRVNLKDYPPLYRIPLLLTHALGCAIPTTLKQTWYDRISMFGSGSEVHIANTLFGHISKRYPKELWDDYITVPFESETLPIVKDYDTLLTILYGNYMTPPEMKDRIPMHSKSREVEAR